MQTLSIPIFPLGATLFPDGMMALKIFEVRYLDMTKKCLRDNTPFGIVTLNQGIEVQVAGKQVEFAEVGTLATIIHFEAVQPSLFMLRCQGGQRFKILQCELQANGLWRAEVELIAPDEVVGIPPELLPTADALTKIIRTLEDQGIAPDQRPIIQPYQLQDCAWVANRCAELLDLPSQQKQHLLTMENPRLRLDLVQELLEDMGVFKEPE
jgi:Lon protease-like protein